MPADEPDENGAESPDEATDEDVEVDLETERVEAEALNRHVDSGQIETTAEVVEEDGDIGVMRSAAFTEIADKPKEKALEDDQRFGDIRFFENLRKFDPELAGTIRAQCQSAASGMGVTHPAIEGERSEMKQLEKEITEACQDLLDEFNIPEEGVSFFQNCVTHGNDVTWIEWEEGEGVTDMTPLPLRLLTIIDEAAANRDDTLGTETSEGQHADYDRLITERDYYILGERSDDPDVLTSNDVLHIALNRRGNWHEDQLGRMTFNVWGEGRLEPVKYAVQTKQNTLANKVAMDDKLLSREFYKINVEELFGHIEDPDVRDRKVRQYASELRELIEDLDADQKPILPEEVSIEIQEPQGETARNMSDFIQTMNDSIQHALTYHVASFGRDAGGTDRGNRPAKEMSDNSVRQLRSTVSSAFRRLFEVHALMKFPEARQPAEDPDGDDALDRYELKDDLVLPKLTFDPVDPQERNDEVKNAATLWEKGVADLNEARAEVGLQPLEEEEIAKRYWHKDPLITQEEVELSKGGSGDDSEGDPQSDNSDDPDSNNPQKNSPSRNTDE